MSRALFSRNADLQRLRNEGYFVQIHGGALVMREVPYVDAERQLRTGALISSLTLAGDQTRPPDTHVIFFDGDFPCEADGTPMRQIAHQSVAHSFGNGVTAKHSFSSKPNGGYTDHHHKMTTYATILSGPAAVLKPGASPRVFRAPEEEEDSVFNYTESASDRVGIGALTERFTKERVAIIGTGGSGAYVFDFVALKHRTRDIVDELDHFMLLAGNNPQLPVEDAGTNWVVRFGEKFWSFPKEDCVVLPIENTTAELLARWLAGRLVEVLHAEHQFVPDVLRVEVEENVGQAAIYEWRR